MSDVPDLTRRLLAGDTRALARAISLIEDRLPAAREIMRTVYPRAGGATVIGVTGPPGAGKSTLVDALTAHLRGQDRRVGIIAVDPSSTFSGGAVLGDRVRMMRHSLDEGVFIRSMATRGRFGGLASASIDAADLMDAAGFGTVILETVGVGQDEVDVVRVADIVLVVLVPGLGDDIQTIKAGIMEIPDIFVLNKADREGIERLHSDVKTLISLMEPGAGPEARPVIVRTVASRGEGIDSLMKTIEEVTARPAAAGSETRRLERSRERVLTLLRERVLEWAEGPSSGGAFDAIVERVAARALDPHAAAESLLDRFSMPQEDTP